MINRYIKTLALFFIIAVHCPVSAQIIRTVAGNGSASLAGSPSYGDSGYAVNAIIGKPGGVTVDTAGNIYVTDYTSSNVRKISALGIITTYAGNGNSGYSGDGGPATAAKFLGPEGISADKFGNVYVADAANLIVRKISPSGIIATAAGIPGLPGYSGDGIAATSSKMNGMANVFCDQAGNIFIADNNTRVRKVTLDGIVHTVAGSGKVGYSGNGAVATDTSVAFDGVQGVCTDKHGNIYIADYSNYVVRKVDASTGILTTIAGLAGSSASSGDGGLATAARFKGPTDVVVDTIGNIYIADQAAHRIRKIDTTGHISTFCGTGTAGFTGDGGSPNLARIFAPTNLWIDRYGNMFIADQSNHRIREIFYPAPMTITNSVDTNLICIGTPVTFYANTNLASYGALYKWYLNGTHVGADTSVYTPISPLNNGDYIYCTLLDTTGGLNITLTTSDTMVMSVMPTNHPALHVITTGDTVCHGLPVTFTATSTNAGDPGNYKWKKFFATVDSGSVFSLIPNNGDIITCILTSTVPCSDPVTLDTSFVLTATTSYAPDMGLSASPNDTMAYFGQLITIFSSVTYGGSSPTFQWYENGHPIPGATTHTYSSHFYADDTLYCVMTSSAMCVVPGIDTSNYIYISTGTLGIDELKSGDNILSLYPNPNNGTFSIDATQNAFSGAFVNVDIRDILGKEVYMQSIPLQNNTLHEKIILPEGLPGGVYYLSAHDGHSTHTLPFVIK